MKISFIELEFLVDFQLTEFLNISFNKNFFHFIEFGNFKEEYTNII